MNHLSTLHWIFMGCLMLASSHVRAQSEPAATESSDDTVGWGSESTHATPSVSPDDDAGWGGDEEDVEASEPAEVVAPRKLRAQGRLRLRNGSWARRFDQRPLAQARVALQLETRYSEDFEVERAPATLRLVAKLYGEYDAAYLIERDRYDAPTREAYEWQLYFSQASGTLSVGPLALSLGKQVAPLGQGEVFSMLDVLNPRDLREPALTDIEDMRLAVFMSRLSLSLGDFAVEGFVVHEADGGLLQPPMGEFSPFRKLILRNPLAGEPLSAKTWFLESFPENSGFRSWQYLGRVAYSGHGVDLELIGGSVLDRYGIPQFPEPAELSSRDLTLKLFHPRYALVGMSGAWAVGELLLRLEIVGERQKPQATLRTDSSLLQIGGTRRDQIGGLIGLTYFGIPHANIGLEVQKAFVFDPPTAAKDGMILLWPVERVSASLRWMQDLADDSVQASLLVAVIGLDRFNGGFLRAELNYNAGRGVRVYATYVKYFARRDFGPFFGFEENDRLQFTLRWDFILV